MKVKLRHEENAYYTHQPVLLAALRASSGPVLELGVGEGSTQIIHDYCMKYKRPVVSVESDKGWLKRYTHLANAYHEFFHIESWETFYADVTKQHWGLAFIDQDSSDGFKNRAESFRRLRDHTDYIVLHDCDAFPKLGLLGKQIRPMINETDPGERDWTPDIFYAKEFHPNRWLCSLGGDKRTGPPTLIASNTLPCDITVDFGVNEVDL
jgi:hypothetical protein